MAYVILDMPLDRFNLYREFLIDLEKLGNKFEVRDLIEITFGVISIVGEDRSKLTCSINQTLEHFFIRRESEDVDEIIHAMLEVAYDDFIDLYVHSNINADTVYVIHADSHAIIVEV